MRYEVGRASRIGNREVNQDRFAAIETEQGIVLVLGDGMGGQARGELAAQALVDVVGAELTRQPLPAADPRAFLAGLLRRAHEAVLAVGYHHDPPIAPGSTAVICLVQEGRAHWAHVGDSRLYLFRQGVPLYRTRDHSYVESLYQAGRLSLDKRQGHPMRNYVTQCIGLRAEDPEIALSHPVALQPGDVLLLCSDGLWEPLDDAQMGALLMSGSLGRALDTMAQRAEELSYPKSDNISALAVRILSLDAHGDPAGAGRAGATPRTASLNDAIEHIEQAIRQYEEEMKAD